MCITKLNTQDTKEGTYHYFLNQYDEQRLIPALAVVFPETCLVTRSKKQSTQFLL
jgi:hypothetical protein